MICGVFFDSFLTTQAVFIISFSGAFFKVPRRLFSRRAQAFLPPAARAAAFWGSAFSNRHKTIPPVAADSYKTEQNSSQKRLYFARDTCYSKNMNLPYARGLESYQGGECHDDRYGCAREDPAVVPGARHYCEQAGSSERRDRSPH